MSSVSASLASARSSYIAAVGCAPACTGKSLTPSMHLCGANSLVCRREVYGCVGRGCCFGVECFGMIALCTMVIREKSARMLVGSNVGA